MCSETETEIATTVKPRLVEEPDAVDVGQQSIALLKTVEGDREETTKSLTPTNSTKPPETPDTSLETKYLTIDRECDWPKTRMVQLFNAFYFGLCGIYFIPYALRYEDLGPSLGLMFCALLAAASSLYLLKHRLHSSVNDELPGWCRDSLRALALGLPITLLSFTSLYFQAPQPDYIVTVPFEEAASPPIPAEAAPPPLSFDEKLKLALKYYDEDNYTKARPLYQEIVDEDPNHSLALENLAECYYHSYTKDSNENALNYANRALAIEPQSAHAVEIKALILNQLKRYSEAQPVAKLATKLYPESGRSFEALATSEKALGHLKAALAADNQHVKLHSNEASAIADRIDTLKKLHRNTDADTKILARMNAKFMARGK